MGTLRKVHDNIIQSKKSDLSLFVHMTKYVCVSLAAIQPHGTAQLPQFDT